MERKNVFAGVVLLTALLSTSSVFAAEQPNWWSRLKATTSTVGSIIKQNRVAVATATATGVVTAGLLYWSWLASNIADNDGYAEATRAEMKNWSRVFAAGGTTAALATATLLKGAYNKAFGAPARVTYTTPEDSDLDCSGSDSDSGHSASADSDSDNTASAAPLVSPEVKECGNRLRRVVAARAARKEGPLAVPVSNAQPGEIPAGSFKISADELEAAALELFFEEDSGREVFLAPHGLHGFNQVYVDYDDSTGTAIVTPYQLN